MINTPKKVAFLRKGRSMDSKDGWIAVWGGCKILDQSVNAHQATFALCDAA